jgi:hypothetical protein
MVDVVIPESFRVGIVHVAQTPHWNAEPHVAPDSDPAFPSWFRENALF